MIVIVNCDNDCFCVFAAELRHKIPHQPPSSPLDRLSVALNFLLRLDRMANCETGSSGAKRARRIVMTNPPGARVDALASTGPAMIDPPARPNRFAGRVLVLTGNNTLSAAAMFAAAVKCNGIAELVGGEPGQATSFLADALPHALPHSGLAFTVSFSEIHMPCDQSYVRGVRPNHPVETTADHLRTGADPVLDHALRLAGEDRRAAAGS